mmetsp:Transcript_63797/g.93410  ORF Transcript_63797/g.93410 Transcript_63797/m.93410 type:complete len:221 (-) Transcript_63797:1651-2313(-)
MHVFPIYRVAMFDCIYDFVHARVIAAPGEGEALGEVSFALNFELQRKSALINKRRPEEGLGRVHFLEHLLRDASIARFSIGSLSHLATPSCNAQRRARVICALQFARNKIWVVCSEVVHGLCQQTCLQHDRHWALGCLRYCCHRIHCILSHRCTEARDKVLRSSLRHGRHLVEQQIHQIPRRRATIETGLEFPQVFFELRDASQRHCFASKEAPTAVHPP